MDPRTQARSDCRAARAALSTSQREAASAAVCKRFRASIFYPRARRIAFFWPLGPELDLRPLMQSALRHHKQCYLPVVRPNGEMVFIRVLPDTRFVRGPFGITEPTWLPERILPAHCLDTVCMPLLGFDLQLNRLGMGGGYYDRAFAFKRSNAQSPILIGTAFACQQYSALPIADWDIPLDAVITERGLLSKPQGLPRTSY